MEEVRVPAGMTAFLHQGAGGLAEAPVWFMSLYGCHSGKCFPFDGLEQCASTC